MATIRTAIKLHDGMTSPLRSIINSMQMTISAFETMQRTSGNAVDTASIEAARSELNKATMAVQQLDEQMASISSPTVNVRVNVPRVEVPVDSVKLEPQEMQVTIDTVMNDRIELSPEQVQLPVEPVLAHGDVVLTPDPVQLPVEPVISNYQDYSPEPIQLPVTPIWERIDSVEVFTGSGLDRYTQEIQSATEMMNQLSNVQEQISAQASSTDIFPKEMVSDIAQLNERVSRLRSTIAQVERNPIDDIGAERANNTVELLRHQLNQAVNSQEALSLAMQEMDVSSAHEAYRRLNAQIDVAEINIRDSSLAQKNFNDNIYQGSRHADGLSRKLKGIFGTIAAGFGLKKAINLSDELSLTKARLELIVDDGGSVQELQEKIYRSSQDARGQYLGTAAAVATLGMQARDAFATNDELIAFVDQLNKSMVIAGTSASGAESVMYNLTQALASGVLRGQDLNAVLSNAQPIVQNIADYMGVPVGQIRDMAAEGQITAEIVKNAMFAAADETNARFESMPMTFGQIWTSITNRTIRAFEPVLNKIGSIANNSDFESLVNTIVAGLVVMANIATTAFDTLTSVAGTIQRNWSWMAPIIWTVVGALVAYNVALGIYKAVTLASAIATGIKATATSALAIATGTATAAQWSFNAALLASPITWILILIVALIAAFYGVIKAVNHFTDNSLSATGILVGAFMTALAFVGNLFVTLANAVIDVFAIIWNTVATFAEFFANVFHDPIGSIVRMFAGMADSILSVIETLASAMDTLFGSSMSTSVQGWRESLDKLVTDLVGEAKIHVERFDPNQHKLERFDYGEAYEVGYRMGENFENTFDLKNILGDAQEIIGSLDDIYGGINDIAYETANISDSLDFTQEELKYMRDLAEQEVINRFTTAEIKVELGGIVNQVSQNTDLDEMVEYLGEKLEERMEIAAEGVYD